MMALPLLGFCIGKGNWECHFRLTENAHGFWEANDEVDLRAKDGDVKQSA